MHRGTPQVVTYGARRESLGDRHGTLRTYRQESHGVPDRYGSIRSMTPSGEVVVVTHLPTMFSDARGIVVGPNNNIWFAERRGAIGEASTDGMLLHEFFARKW